MVAQIKIAAASRFLAAPLFLAAALLPASAMSQGSPGARDPARGPTGPAVLRPEIPLGLDLYLPVPEDNPLTREKVALGRKLFHDPILSQDGSLACAGCHDPERAFTDGRAVSVGVFGRVSARSVPTLVNRAYGSSFFWDGRTSSLEEQVLQPIQDPKELDMTLKDLVVRLRRHREYPEAFQATFGRIPTSVDLANALASYVRTILSGDAAIDRYRNGEIDALSDQARQGLRIFQGKANCSACHVGPNFTDERFHNTGVAWRDGELLDPGRFAVTGKEEDRGAFKTPTLRNVERTAPYMHDGSIATLREAIEFYDRGGNANPHRDGQLHPLDLTTDGQEALLAFLNSLSGRVREGMEVGRGAEVR